MNEGLAGLFFFLCFRRARRKKKQRNSNRCLAELTENVESGSHFSFFGGLNFEQVPVRAYRNCGEWIALFFFFLGGGLNLEQVLCGGSTALFFFLGGLNLEQVLGRAYRKCGGSTALFFFLGCLNLEQVLGRAYRKCGERG